MIIQKVDIYNFKCYYGNNSFEFINGLNIIYGRGGTGKTAFCDAIRWLLSISINHMSVLGYICYKRISELHENESEEVRVSLTYEHKGITKVLEKKLCFKKTNGKDIEAKSPITLLYDAHDTAKTIRVSDFNDDFPMFLREKLIVDDDYCQNIVRPNFVNMIINHIGVNCHVSRCLDFTKKESERFDFITKKEILSKCNNPERVKRLLTYYDVKRRYMDDLGNEKLSLTDELSKYEKYIEKIRDSFKPNSNCTSTNMVEKEIISPTANKLKDSIIKINRIKERLSELDHEILHQNAILTDLQNELSEIQKESNIRYLKIVEALKHLNETLESVKEEEQREIVCKIEQEANEYFRELDDFGIEVKIKIENNNECQVVFVNEQDTVIKHPNYAMVIHAFFSFIFALNKFYSKMNSTQFPLFYEPTALPDGGLSIYKLANKLGIQMIATSFGDYNKKSSIFKQELSELRVRTYQLNILGNQMHLETMHSEITILL